MIQICRELKKQDFPRIRDIIHEAWGFEQYADEPKTVERFLNLYLYDYLSRSNIAMVVEEDGQVVSFLFGRCARVPVWRWRIRYRIPLFFTAIPCLFTKEGRLGLHVGLVTARTDRELIRFHRKQFDGELCLFATDQHDRGHGAGHDLLEAFHHFLRQHGARRYFVYTDTYSNYHFYDKEGYELISSDTVDFEDGEPVLPKYFLYSYDLDRDAAKPES